jgi:hypothetical protein
MYVGKIRRTCKSRRKQNRGFGEVKVSFMKGQGK